MSRPTLRQLLASGELSRLAKQFKSQADLARYIGITEDGFRSARRKLRDQGLHFPTFVEMKYGAQAAAESSEEPDFLEEIMAERGFTESDLRRASDFSEDEKTNPGIHPDIPLAPIPSGFSARDVSTNVDPDGNTLKQWIGARRDGEHFEQVREAQPLGHYVKGVSTLIDERGNVRAQWIKTNQEQADKHAAMIEAFKAIKEELPRADGPQPRPEQPLNNRLLSTYLLGDCHVGMRAWQGDAGANFDLRIAERNLSSLTADLINLAPPSERALIVNIGDYFHSDNRTNTTTKGTPVDVDGRWSKVLEVGIRIMRRIIDRALQKHDHVTVINEIGNHDTHTSIFLSLALAQFYEGEPRVTIDTSPRMFHYYRFGKVLIMSHHGHNVKPRDLVGVLASDRAEDWGQTLFRYIYTGHIHHERSCEFPGAYWRSLRSPATSDAWHDSMGYRSGHELSLEIHDAERGLINRHIVGVPRDLGKAA